MFLRILLIVALGMAAVPTVCTAGETVGRGDFEFFLDSAAFRMPDGSTRQEVYIRVPTSGLRFKEVGGRLEAKPRVSVRIRNAKGKTVIDDSGEFTVLARDAEQAANPLGFQTLTKNFHLEEGVYRLSCKVEDQYAPKVTVVGMMKNQYKASLITNFPLEIPTFPDDRLTLSDAMFVWKVGKRGDDKTYVPNPMRMYGLYRDSLNVFLEAYVPRSIASGEELTLQTTILDMVDSTLTASSVIVPRAEPQDPAAQPTPLAEYPVLLTHDLNRFPAGQYAVYVEAAVRGETLLRRLIGSFQVAWDLRTWETTRHDLIAEARFLLDPNDFKGFEKKSVGEQEAIVQRMWADIDPDPTTGVNEAYEKYLERVAYVEAKYSDYQLGIFSDRGLIYLKYGPPDETVIDVIPLNRETLSDALAKIEDRFHPINYSNTGGSRAGYATPQQSIVVDPRRLGAVGEGGDTAFPFELWIYNGSGNPIRETDHALEPDHGLRFIFVDREGYGRYRLESSSSMANK